MLNASEGADSGSIWIVEEDPWDEVTVVIPAEQLEMLREVMDSDERPTERLQPVREEFLAVGTMTAFPQSAAVCGEVSGSPRAAERTVSAAPAAARYPDWLIAIALALLAIELFALSW